MSAMPESTLADSERLIADLQRQLAECRAERDEAIAQVSATTQPTRCRHRSMSCFSTASRATRYDHRITSWRTVR
jgi:hypothetical protein